MAPPALRLAIHAVGSRCRRGKSTIAHLAWSLAPAIADPRGALWRHTPGRSSTEEARQRNAPGKRALGVAQAFRASLVTAGVGAWGSAAAGGAGAGPGAPAAPRAGGGAAPGGAGGEFF